MALVNSVHVPTNGVAIEVAPRNRRIHAHFLVEVKHHAVIRLDWKEIRDQFNVALPAHLKPSTGSVYVSISAVPASTHYVLDYIRKGEKMNDLTAQDLDDIATQLKRVVI